MKLPSCGENMSLLLPSASGTTVQDHLRSSSRLRIPGITKAVNLQEGWPETITSQKCNLSFSFSPRSAKCQAVCRSLDFGRGVFTSGLPLSYEYSTLWTLVNDEKVSY